MILVSLLVSFIFQASAVNASTIQDLDSAISKSQWDDAVQISYELLSKNPNMSEAKVKGAYALFQKGYANAALVLLKRLSNSDWKTLPQGQDRLVEIVSLFQKKIPLIFLPWRLEQLNDKEVSPNMANEVQFLKGRMAYEKGDTKSAHTYLESISKNSRYYSAAHYLLGSMYADAHDYTKAAIEFSSVLQPTVLDQSTEFWKDVSAQMTVHWGANFQVLLDTELLAQSQTIAELTYLALARTAYGAQDFETALDRYSRISKNSPFYKKALLERIWTLWALNRHSDAQKAASDLAVDESSFHSIEARTMRAIILVDSGDTEEARKELKNINQTYAQYKKSLDEYNENSMEKYLPAFIQTDLKTDLKLSGLRNYTSTLQSEIKKIRDEDHKFFPAYATLVNDLELMLSQTRSHMAKLIQQHVNDRLAQLDKLNSQTTLIVAEAYLEDREKLKLEIKSHHVVDEESQHNYDQRLAKLLSLAISEIDKPIYKSQKQQLKLQFRQGELLWELGTANIILSQSTGNKSLGDEGVRQQKRSLELIRNLVNNSPQFEKHNQALFFLAFALDELGKTEEAMQTFFKYVKLYPHHTHVPDAYRIIADKKFDENHFKEAEEYYKKILEVPDSPLIGYAFYKLGWCAYNQRAFARALLGLEKTALWTAENSQNQQLLGLAKEARRDLISIYSEVGDYKKAFEYFKRFPSTDGKDWIVELAQQYDNNGQYEKAQALHRTLILIDPTSPENIIYRTGIIQSAYHLQKWDVVLDNFNELAQNNVAQLSKPKQEPSSEYSVEKTLREITMAHQFDFKQSNDPQVISRVIKLNELYLSTFKQWPSTQQPLYRHAQYLLEKEKYSDALIALRQHWTQFQHSLEEPVKEEALRNLIHTLGKLEEKKKDTDPNTLTESDELIGYVKKYLSTYQDTKYARAIAYLGSTTLLKYGHTEEGIILSQKLFDANATDDIGNRTFKNLTKAYYELKDWKRTYEWADKIKSHNSEIQTIKEESSFLWAESITDDVQSAELFMRMADDKDMIKHREKSLYNAFIRYQKANKKVEALKTADKLEKTSPEYPGLQELSGLRAALYQEAGDYVHALPLLEKFIKNNSSTDSTAVKQAHLNIGLILEALGQWDSARLHFKKYLEFKDRTPAAEQEAQRGLARLDTRSNTEEKVYFKNWPLLMKEREEFEKRPLLPNKDLVQKLKLGAERLQNISQKFINISNSTQTPPYYAVEAYCVTPFLYSHYTRAVRVAGGDDKELQLELEKVTAPLDEKVHEFANNCINSAARLKQSGPIFKSVLETWGWKQDPQLEKNVTQLVKELREHGPWLEPIDLGTTEEDIINLHLNEDQNSEKSKASWLQLARIRYEKKQYGLSRLTYIDALSKNPKDSGAYLNGLACIELSLNHKEHLSELFEKAGESGSPYAWANSALIMLSGDHLTSAMPMLEKALDGHVFDDTPSIKNLVKELRSK